MELLIKYFDALGVTEIVGGTEQLLKGLQEIQMELLRVGLDVQMAKARQQPLAEAALDFDNYPFLARMHVGIEDLLRWSLPPQMEAGVRKIFTEPPLPIIDDLRATLVEMAAADPNPVMRSVCEWALFEGMRINLMIRIDHYPEETSLIGFTADDVARIAEDTVAIWLKPPVPSPDGIRSFEVMVAGAFVAMDEHAQELKQAMALVQKEYREEVERKARLDQLVGEFDAADAVLIKNALAPRLGEQQLSIELLQKRHPYVLGVGSRNALDQRISRTKKKLSQGGVPAVRRKAPALIDIIKEVGDTSETERRD